jgi:peptide deformylase
MHRMPLDIIVAGAPVLRASARPLTPDEVRSPRIATLIDEMREAMRRAPGVGLAAPQVGESLQLAVIEDRAEYHRALSQEDLAARGRVPVPFQVIVNPRLTVIEPGPARFQEGCLSVPAYAAVVPRALSVRVDALDHRGEPISFTAAGWHARIVQHEVDHLRGILYVDRMDPLTFARKSV